MHPKIVRNPGEGGMASSRSLLILAQVVIILVAIVIFIAMIGPRQTIRCERVAEDTVDCTVTRTLFDLIVLKEISIPGVLAANLDERCSGTDCAYALQMYGNNGFVQVNEDYVRDLTLRQKLADTINEFLQDSEGHAVEMKDQINPSAYIASGVIFLLLFGLLGFTLWSQCQD
jgi:hypothetical protein